MQTIFYISVIAIACLFSCGEKQANSLILNTSEQLSYNYHIRPILSDNCFTCHGPDANKREAGLRLDIAEEAYKALKESPGEFALIPHDSKNSKVYRRVSSTDPNEQMPPPESNLFLSSSEIELIRKWIDQGAEYEPHWAFVPPKKVSISQTKVNSKTLHPIDYFIGVGLKQKGLKANPVAENAILIKRLSQDLTGLPPGIDLLNHYKPQKIEEFYEVLVDKLLDSPAYGEKMAALWMDIARYADSYGYQDDNIRTQWPYRDWVIHAFNKNLPYDKFITWQLAGDLVPEKNKETILATAFNRNHKYTEEGGVIEEEYRIEYILDKTNTYSKGILGLTAECAQCHDHKYDPVSQKNYFELFAFFNNTPEKGYEGDVMQSKPAKTPILWIDTEDTADILNFINHTDTSRLMVSVMEELDSIRTTYLLERGVYDAPGERVTASVPPAVLDFPENYPKNRLGLAKWTVNPENPLTARVFVNLVWQEIFGQGIVSSTGDFGMQGALPTHPELLDWLAVDFMENGWDIKRLIKTIVTSETYKQSSIVSKSQLEKDPENQYLARAPRLRFSAENIRDLVLASSGLLVREIGGPSVKPYQPAGLWEAATSGRGELKTYKQDTGEKLYRRGLYTFIKLTSPPPMPIIFDGSNRDQCEVNRGRTNTPLQALVMLNDPLVLEASSFLAAELTKKHTAVENAITEGYLRIINREPTLKEQDILIAYYQEEVRNTQPGFHTISNRNTTDSSLSKHALSSVINLLYNLEEAITKV